MKKLIILSSFLFFFMHSTFAGPHIEPYYLQTVGSLGEVKEKSRSSAANREFVHKGNLYGLKVGWNFKENIAAGLDFGLSSSKWTLDSPASIKTVSYTHLRAHET